MIRAEIHERLKKINETKSCFFQNKIDRPLARLPKKKKTQNQKTLQLVTQTYKRS